MDEKVLVEFRGVSKKYCRQLKRSLWYGLSDLTNELAGRVGNRRSLRPAEFWALRDVSFTVRRGEMLGLVGSNGAGKSTILKLLSGLIRPDEGEIHVRGRVQALIELGAGFSSVLSGRENVYVNAAIHGIPKAKVDEALPYILDFAGLEEFADAPIQSYSSGMRARLGFAVITQLDPDVLLIDEVLAVGDTAFQEKCMRRLEGLRRSDKAIVFVTHSLYQVEALCNRALWLDRGKVAQYGGAREVVRAYLDDQERLAMAQSKAEGVEYEGRVTSATKVFFEARDAERGGMESGSAGKSGDEDLIEIRKVDLLDGAGQLRTEFPFFSDVTIRIAYRASARVYSPLFNLRFMRNGIGVFETSMLIDGHGPDWVEGDGVVECRIKRLPLTPKVYDLLLFVRSREGVTDLTAMRTVAQLRITDDQLHSVPLRGPMAINHLRQGPPVYLAHAWRFSGGGGEDREIEVGPG